jgi:pyrroloquinoline quinone (PQQ) biosynthesis protein C
MNHTAIATLLKSEIVSFSNDLQANHPLMRSAIEGRVEPATVALYLSGVLYLLQHSRPHIAAAEEAAIRRRLLPLARFFGDKQGQEAGHDRWASSDLAAMVSRYGLDVPPVLSSMRELVRYNGDLAQNEPEHYLAYAFFAELFTVHAGEPWATALHKHCGIPEGALTSIFKHAELDKHHVAEAMSEIDALLGARVDTTSLLNALRGSMDRLARFFDELHVSGLGKRTSC